MLYVFGFLSVLSPTIFLQSRLLDSPLTPTTGVQQSCLGSVCLVSPRPGTSLQQFIKAIPPSDIPVISPGPQVKIPDAMLGDDDDGGGGGDSCRYGGRWEVEGRAYVSPFYIAQQGTPPSAKRLSSVMAPSKSRTVCKNNTGRGSVARITSSGLLSSASRPLALPQCLSLDKAHHLRNDTCACSISGNDLPVVLPSLVNPRLFDQHRCLLNDKALHLANETCLATIPSPLPSIKVIINSRPVPQRRCSISDKAFHLLNDTCLLATPVRKSLQGTVEAERPVIDLRPDPQRQCLVSDKALHLFNNTCVLATSVTRASEQIIAVELPTFDATRYRPISGFFLPCLRSGQARRGAPQNCGHNAAPNLTTALDWDITAQAALLSAQVVDQTPAFFVAPTEPEFVACRRCGLGTAGPVALPASAMPPASVTRGHSAVFESSWLRSIRMANIIVAIVSVLGCIFRGTEQTENLKGLDAVSKVEGPVSAMIPAEAVNCATPKDDLPPPMVLKTKPSPAKAKCRIVGGKRVQPISRTTPTRPPAAEGASSAGTTAKKSRKAKAPRP